MGPCCCPERVPQPPHGGEDPRSCSAFSAGLIPFGFSSDTTRKASALFPSDVPRGGHYPVSVPSPDPPPVQGSLIGHFCLGPWCAAQSTSAGWVRFHLRMPTGRKAWPTVGSVVLRLFQSQRTETGDKGKGRCVKSRWCLGRPPAGGQTAPQTSGGWPRTPPIPSTLRHSPQPASVRFWVSVLV